MCREGAGFVAAYGGELFVFTQNKVLSEPLRPDTAHSLCSHTRRARSIFCAVHVAAKNKFNFFRRKRRIR